MVHGEDIARAALGDRSLKVLQTDNGDGTGRNTTNTRVFVCRVFLKFPKP